MVCLPAALARDFDRAVGRWAIVRCVDAVARSGFAAPRTRWEADGDVDGEGREVTWRPASASDQLRLAVRSAGGVAVVALRARDVGAS